MNRKLRQVVRRLERQGYRFSFDDDTPDEVVERTLDLVFADDDDDLTMWTILALRALLRLLPHGEEAADDADFVDSVQ
jgi:hypothetical protein